MNTSLVAYLAKKRVWGCRKDANRKKCHICYVGTSEKSRKKNGKFGRF